MMSKQMLSSFFPGLFFRILEPYLPGTLAVIFPDDVVEAFPEQGLPISLPEEVTILTITIRRPFLAGFAILGILVGFVGSCRLWLLLVLRSNNEMMHSSKKDAGWNKPRNYWIIAFLSFGLMNFSGLFLHCLQSFPQETGISPLQRHFFWIGDCYTTGVFGVSLWAASMLESLPLAYYQQQQQQQQRQQNSTIQTGANDFCLWIQGCWIFANLFGIYAIIAFLVFGYKHDSLVPGTMLLETWYAVPATGFASTGLIYMLYQHWSVQLCAFYCLSLVMFVVATVGDAWFCRQFGTKYLDLLTTPTLFFAATDVVYIGLELWLEKRYSGVSSTKQKTG